MAPEGQRPNFYAGGGIDRAASLRHDAGWLAERLRHPSSWFVPVWRTFNLVRQGAEPSAGFLAGPSVAEAGRQVILLGLVEARACFAVDLSHWDDPAPLLPEAHAFADLRGLGPLLSQRDGALLAYARGLVHWHDRHRHCGVCGGPTESAAAGHLRRCANPACKAEHFPRTDPAVIMLVEDGRRIVLGRQKAWPPGMHSVLAGFVEPGESLEEAVRREVKEEIGIEVAELRYRSSQPWPFPASIMLGFTARALSCDLDVAMDELEAARWYTRDELLASPENEVFRLPRRDSIARRLIEDWLAGV
jgi:NAD+ diphosphatase